MRVAQDLEYSLPQGLIFYIWRAKEWCSICYTFPMFSARIGHTKAVAVADIGSGPPAVALFVLERGKPARLVVCERGAAMLDKPESSETAVLAQLSEVATKVAAGYAKAGAPKARAVYAMIRAPWANSAVAHSSVAYPQETTITDPMIRTLAQTLLDEKKDIDHAQLFEVKAARVEINGYATAFPDGKKGTSLGISAVFSTCSPSFKAGVMQTLAKSFGIEPEFCSGVRAYMNMARSGACAGQCVVVDMNGEATDIACIRDGTVEEHTHVSEGAHSIVRKIAGSDMPEHVLSVLRMSAQDRCEDAACEEVNAKILAIEPELARTFGAALAALSANHRLPNSMVLFASPDLQRWLADFFSRIDFAQFTLTTKPFSVQFVSEKQFAPFIEIDNGVVADAPILLAGALVNTEHSTD